MNLADLLPDAERLSHGGFRVRAAGVFGLARSRDLMASGGVSKEHAAAVLVSCRGTVRTCRRAEIQVGPQRAARMWRGEPPRSPTPEERRYEVLVELRPLAACTHCAVSGQAQPGLIVCTDCSGTGRCPGRDSDEIMFAAGGAGLFSSSVTWALEAGGVTCRQCAGQRLVLCPWCEGAGEARRAVVDFVTDSPVVFEHTYVPSLSAALESRLEVALGSAGSPPDCLRVEACGEAVDFAGYPLGDRVDRAKRAITRLIGDARDFSGQVEVFAWPLLLLRPVDGRSEAAVFIDARGAPRSVVDDSS
jgi:hypothetical protein